MKGNKLFFVDTNLLVYAKDETDPIKHNKAISWLQFLWSSGRGRLSYQVLSEYYVTVTQKLKPGREIALAQRDIKALIAWSPQTITDNTFESAWKIQIEGKISWWDSLILASAAESGSSYVLTEDLQENRSIGGVRLINPFKLTPENLGGEL
jgi:predicted nucleic acid-binding protein